ncbi:MAG: glycosyltransferase family 2 protein [Culicoidibacterales bacterium]
MNIDVSIILPIYNVEKYLGQCLDSLLNQSFDNFEIIAINDGSTDSSLQILKNYSEKDDRIKVYSQKNQGLSVARNEALKKVKGKYTIFVDSDDYFESTMIEKIFLKAEKFNSQIVIFGHREVYDDTVKGKDVAIYLNYDDLKVYTNNQVSEELLKCNILGTAWNKLFLTNFIVANNLFFEPGRYVQDWFPCFEMVTLAEKICFINEPLYNYRMRGNATTSKKTQKNIDDYTYAANNIINLSREKGFSEETILTFQTIAFKTVINRYYNTYKYQMYKELAKNNLEWFGEVEKKSFKDIEIKIYKLKLYPLYKSVYAILRYFKNKILKE